ncbi:hypothetical protein ACFL35_21575 [Candidatus Riflebacteria bacterium]
MSLEKIIQRYVEIENIIAQLEEEKDEIRDALKNMLLDAGAEKRIVDTKEHIIQLSLSKRTRVEYDEEKLKARLGDKIRYVLTPDIKRIRQNFNALLDIPEVDPLKYGKPAKNLVKQCIQNKVFRLEEFSGTFEKSIDYSLSVRKKQKRDVVEPF